MQSISKIINLIKRGLVTKDRSSEEGQCSFMETTSNYEAVKPYGLNSIPKQSSESLVILMNLNGNESTKIGLEYDNKLQFLTETIQPGEVVIYNPTKQTAYSIFKNDGEVRHVGTKIAIGNSTTELLQKISDTLAALATHVHSSVTGPTGVADNASTYTTIKNAIDAIKGTIS